MQFEKLANTILSITHLKWTDEKCLKRAILSSCRYIQQQSIVCREIYRTSAMPSTMRWPLLITFVYAATLTSAAMGQGCNRVSQSFTAVKSENGSNLCAFDGPSSVMTEVRSRVQCSTMCRQNGDCDNFNYKDDSSRCELYAFAPCNYKTVQHCKNYVKVGT